MTAEQISRVTYEAERAYLRALGNDTVPGFDDIPDSQQAGEAAMVQDIINELNAGKTFVYNPAIPPQINKLQALYYAIAGALK